MNCVGEGEEKGQGQSGGVRGGQKVQFIEWRREGEREEWLLEAGEAEGVHFIAIATGNTASNGTWGQSDHSLTI